MVVIAGVSVAVPFHAGKVNGVKPESAGVSVALAPLVYPAVMVTDCPAVIVLLLAVIVHPAAHVWTAPLHMPEQSDLQWLGVPFNAHSSHCSSGKRDFVCRAMKPLS